MTPLTLRRPLRLLFAPLLLVLLLAVSTSAQSGKLNSKVWAAVAFINRGEKTPSLGGLQIVLTPLGAQQMWKQGSAFRGRYLTGSDTRNASLANSSGSAPIQSIASNAIDNSQLTILSQTDEWVAGGATAFLQGLYPPNAQAFNRLAGGQELTQEFATGANQTSYPLGGYQYPKIQTLSSTDPASVAIQGTVGCTAWDSKANATEKEDLAGRFKATDGFYQSLFSSAPLKGTIPVDQAHYGNAYGIWELVNYMNTHNKTVFQGLELANDTLATLRGNAFELERTRNSINDKTNNNDASSVISTVAGRTLVKKVADSFSSVTQGNGSKLTLMFGSFEPLLAFFSISDLFDRENLLSGPFSTLPEPGAAMVFELIGDNPNDAAAIPATEDLLIRFLYRASAAQNEPFSVYPLFASGFDGFSIPYTAFLSSMQRFAQDPSQWCDLCNPTSATWCKNSPFGSSAAKHGVKPVVAGVMGAMATIAVVGMAGIALYGFGACRLGRSSGSSERHGTSGGFKGAEKLASDADVTVSKGGLPHERIGSWELSDGDNKASKGSVGIVTTDLGKDILRPPQHMDGDGISMIGVPVAVRESV